MQLRASNFPSNPAASSTAAARPVRSLTPPPLAATSTRAAAIAPCAHQGDAHCSEPNVDRRHVLSALALAPALAAVGLAPSPASAAAVVVPGEPLSPEAWSVVKGAFDKAAGKGKSPGLLRIVFHDAGTYSTAERDGGANASVQFELDRPENFGLKRYWKALERVQKELGTTALANQLSMADLIALGGAYAVQMTGGPLIPVLVGRPDATSPDPENRLPPETLDAAALKAVFSRAGLSTRELVALSGAHAIGGKGFGDPLTFDTVYYKTLLEAPWKDATNEMAQMIGLATDHVLPEDADCLEVVKEYASDEKMFFADFSAAFVKLTCLGTGLEA